MIIYLNIWSSEGASSSQTLVIGLKLFNILY